MQEWQKWERPRYVALLVVLALHAAVLTGLVIAAWTRILTTPTAPPIELLILPQKTSPPVPPPPPVSNRRRKIAATPQALPADALTAITPNSNPDVIGPPIDWSQEAHNVAASIAKGALPLNDTNPSSSHSPFAAPAPHYKGEQILTADGRWTVFVSENCYQLSKALTYIADKTNTGVKIQTYCNRRSKEPRGDLFNQLAAYKKYHPND
ncbi:MAG TPA: hypothetical protein VGD54_13450 [Steroidobacteraceae bacterium]